MVGEGKTFKKQLFQLKVVSRPILAWVFTPARFEFAIHLLVPDAEMSKRAFWRSLFFQSPFHLPAILPPLDLFN